MSRVTQALICFVSAALLLAIAALVYYERSFMGFPDGHLSDFDQARKYLLAVFVVGAFVSATVFAGIGVRSLSRDLKGWIAMWCVVTALFIAVLVAIDAQNFARLGSGVG